MTNPTHTRKLYTAAAALSLAAGASAQLTLTWADEFNGTELDLSTWDRQIGTGTAYGLPAGWGNSEFQFYTTSTNNVNVQDGVLNIIARNENFGGRNFTSARIRTINNVDLLYGRIEGRIQLPTGPNMWPAFWMLATNSPYGGWAASGEIDIMESVNEADRVYGTIHHGGLWPNNTSRGTSFIPGPDLSQSFHTYAIEWDPDQIRWYFDGDIYNTIYREQWFSDAAPSDGNAPFDQPFHLILNVAVGGTFPGSQNPQGLADYPQTMKVDWVRAYAFEQVAYPDGTPHAIPGEIQAEDFDTGYGGLAYNEADGSNNGGDYRDTAVDVDQFFAGHYVGWIDDGDWMEYTVNVAQAGTYEARFRVASQPGSGTLLLRAAGADITGVVPVPQTGSWTAFTDLTRTVQLDAGTQVLRFENAGTPGRFNLDEFELTLIEASCVPDLTTTGTSNGTPDGTVDLSDFSYYLSLWSGGDARADVTTTGSDNGIPDAAVDLSDFSYYLSLWSAGCP